MLWAVAWIQTRLSGLVANSDSGSRRLLEHASVPFCFLFHPHVEIPFSQRGYAQSNIIFSFHNTYVTNSRT